MSADGVWGLEHSHQPLTWSMMMYSTRLLCSALFLTTVSASPVKSSNTPSGSTSLAIFLTVSGLLSLLVLGKCIFLKKRRAQHPSPSFAPSAIGIVSVNEKSGFIVGFLGSPAWETRIEKSTWRAFPNSPPGFRLQNHHLENKSATTPNTSIEDDFTAQGLGHLPSPFSSRSNFGNMRASYGIRHVTTQRKSRSLRLPKRPSGAYTTSLVGHVLRRSSLPSTRRRISDASTLPFSGNSTLRLVESRRVAPEYPLPLVPKQTQLEAFATPLPKMPPPSFQNGRGVSPQSGSISQLVTPVLRISHPYALSALSSSMTVTSSRSSKQLSSSFKNRVRSGRSPLAAINSPTNHNSTTTVTPLALRKPAKTLHNDRRSSRPRRSPPLGPSPLRAMILPDVSDSSFCVNSNKNISKSSSRRSLDLGLGLSLPLQKSSELHRANTQNPASYLRKDCFVVGNARSGKAGAEDPNILLGIIRELVEETKEWDNNLFMNQDFKSMIENSEVFALDNTFLPSPSCQSQDRIKRNRESNPQGDAGNHNHETPEVSYWEDETTKE